MLNLIGIPTMEWHLLQFDSHRLLRNCIITLNKLLQTEPALYEKQFSVEGFEWIDLDHRQESVIVYRRKGKDPQEDLLVVLNMTPVVRNDWKITVSGKEFATELFNSDSSDYWGTGNVYNPAIRSTLVDEEKKEYELLLNLPPLAAVILK